MSEKEKTTTPSPIRCDLKAGEKYAYCTCGFSQNAPFCDGSHKGTGMSPKIFTVEEDRTAGVCNCKLTNNAPFCDGTHKTINK